MIHASSISKKEVTMPMSLKDSLNRVKDFDDKLKFNSLQLRGLVSQAETQTDLHIKDVTGVDADTQVNMLDDEIARLRSEVDRLLTSLESEVMRSGDRERILISQMNAIRDQQAIVRRRSETEISISVRFHHLDLNLKKLPIHADSVSFSVSAVDVLDEQVIFSKATDPKDIDQVSESELYSVQLRLGVPQDTGKMYLLFSGCAFERGNDSAFKVILGEWASQPFVPSLKDLHQPEMLRVLFQACGIIDVELIFS
jgi:hypothetical protein